MKEHGNQKELILKAAYDCIAEKGYANSSLRTIARTADVTLSQLHYYYGNKEELFKAVINEMVDGYLNEVRRLLAKQNTENRKSIVRMIRSILEDTPEYCRILFDLASLSMRNDEFRKLFSALFEEMEGLIETSITENRENITDLEDFRRFNLSKVLLGTIIGISFQYTFDPERNAELLDAVDHMATLII